MDVVPDNAKDAAKLIVGLHMSRLRKFVAGNQPKFSKDLTSAYTETVKQYCKLHPTFDKISRRTEWNANGDCAGLVKKLINGL